MSRFFHTGAGLVVALAAAGCATGDGTTAPAAGNGRVVFQVATTPMGASGVAGAAASVTVTKGTDVVVISDVQLVARRIRLERAPGSCSASASDGSGEHQGSGDQDSSTPSCPDLRVGPFLLTPPLTDGTETSFPADLPAGTYRELNVRIWHPSAKTEDDAFRAAHPEFATISIRVTGTFNGAPFTFTSDIQAEQDIEFPTAVVVASGATTNVTLLLDVKGWFLGHDGGLLLNPGTLDASTRAQVEQNIRASFRSFEDHDGDGHEG